MPDGGGYPVCGLYDISFAKFGQSNNVVKLANGFGEQLEVYNGVDFSLNARLPRGFVDFRAARAPVDVLTDNCFVIDSPQRLLNCKTVPPFQTQVKLILVYPLPWWGLQTAATIQSMPGPEITASYAASNAQIVPTLGRNLASCGAAATVCNGTATVPLLAPGTYFRRPSEPGRSAGCRRRSCCRAAAASRRWSICTTCSTPTRYSHRTTRSDRSGSGRHRFCKAAC